MNFSDELKKEMFNFAFAVYRVTDLFRPDEALRQQLREHAGEVLIGAIRYNQLSGNERVGECGSISTFLEAVRSLIELARQSGLMKAINAEILIRECLALEAYFAEERTMLYRGEIASKRHEVKNGIPLINDTGPPQAKAPRNSEKLATEVTATVRQEEFSITGRQKAIIDYLKANKEAKINDLATMFSNRFSLKTMQRDLARLITERHVERHGDKRWAVYRLPGALK